MQTETHPLGSITWHRRSRYTTSHSFHSQMVFITRLLGSQMRTLPPLPDCNLQGRTFIIAGGNSGAYLKSLVELH